MSLSAEQIEKNWKEYRNRVNELFPNRSASLNKMYDYFEERMVMMPASSVDHFHNAFEGGYVDHVLRVMDCAESLYNTWEASGASVDDLKPAIKEFHGLVTNFIAKSKLIFALNRIGTIAEDAEARAYIKEAGYETFEGCLLERPAYRKAQNLGFSVTETNYKTLNEKADVLMQNLIDRVIKNG